MSVYVVIDEGCQECGVDSIPVGIFATADEAATAKAEHEAEHHSSEGWRDGGQAWVYVYEMELPS